MNGEWKMENGEIRAIVIRDMEKEEINAKNLNN
jgi:hypothetical protein